MHFESLFSTSLGLTLQLDKVSMQLDTNICLFSPLPPCSWSKCKQVVRPFLRLDNRLNSLRQIMKRLGGYANRLASADLWWWLETGGSTFYDCTRWRIHSNWHFSWSQLNIPNSHQNTWVRVNMQLLKGERAKEEYPTSSVPGLVTSVPNWVQGPLGKI